MSKRGGIITFQIDGVTYDAKGSFTANLGRPLRESIVGSSGVHGYKETAQPASIEGTITDRSDLDLAKLVTLTGVTVAMTQANGKMIVLRDAWFAGEGSVETEEGEIEVRFEAISGEEVS